MARRSLALLSEGMLSGSLKKTITIASIGWLVITGGPIPPIPPIPPGTGSGGGGSNFGHIIPDSYDKDKQAGRKKRIKKDDDEFWAIVKMWTEANNN